MSEEMIEVVVYGVAFFLTVLTTIAKIAGIFLFLYTWTWLPLTYIRSQYSNATIGPAWYTNEGLYQVLMWDYFSARFVLAMTGTWFVTALMY